jgi:hypothetical protein
MKQGLIAIVVVIAALITTISTISAGETPATTIKWAEINVPFGITILKKKLTFKQVPPGVQIVIRDKGNSTIVTVTGITKSSKLCAFWTISAVNKQGTKFLNEELRQVCGTFEPGKNY